MSVSKRQGRVIHIRQHVANNAKFDDNMVKCPDKQCALERIVVIAVITGSFSRHRQPTFSNPKHMLHRIGTQVCPCLGAWFVKSIIWCGTQPG
jgi:hypothetical protein